MGRPQPLLRALYHELIQQTADSVDEISRSLGQSLEIKDEGRNQLCETIVASR